MYNNFDDIIICSTDTVNGIGGSVNDLVLEKIYFLKKRPIDKKIMILVSSIEQAKKFSQWNEQASEWAKKYWPGAFSIVVNDQGFRMPNNKKLLEFLEKNGPHYMSSANISSRDVIKLSESKKVFPMVKNIYDFGESSGSASNIYILEQDKWIIRDKSSFNLKKRK